MHTFDTSPVPIGYLERNYYRLRSLYKFAVKALLKTLRVEASHPLNDILPRMLGPLLLVAVAIVVFGAGFCCWCCCRVCRGSAEDNSPSSPSTGNFDKDKGAKKKKVS
eukprot:TRINITY_DN32747_c0_g1_i1.p1 TRINITY_DN32747_c0_g1~~TRINITY_DN32747_c0_g1_i1.p1  ORF type:complete len:108 (-),score=7.42 TRINITY_DN32747_c0_g1_i1:62-385(-)